MKQFAENRCVELCMSVALAVFLLCDGAAAPQVEVSSFAQCGERVLVGYSLSAGPAIVTVDFLTNGVSIGESKVFAGDCYEMRLYVPDGRKMQRVAFEKEETK